MKKDLNLTQKIVTIEPKNVIYTSLTGDYLHLDYVGAWQKVWDYMKEALGKKTDAEIEQYCRTCECEYIVIYNDDPEITDAGEQRADICLSVKDKIEPKGDIGTKMIQGGKYAVFTYIGPYDNLGEVYNYVFAKLIPESGLQLAPRPMFDKYCNDPETNKPEDYITELYIPVL